MNFFYIQKEYNNGESSVLTSSSRGIPTKLKNKLRAPDFHFYRNYRIVFNLQLFFFFNVKLSLINRCELFHVNALLVRMYCERMKRMHTR